MSEANHQPEVKRPSRSLVELVNSRRVLKLSLLLSLVIFFVGFGVYNFKTPLTPEAYLSQGTAQTVSISRSDQKGLCQRLKNFLEAFNDLEKAFKCSGNVILKYNPYCSKLTSIKKSLLNIYNQLKCTVQLPASPSPKPMTTPIPAASGQGTIICGGLMGLVCPEGYVCEADPQMPKEGADISGICRPSGSDKTGPLP